MRTRPENYLRQLALVLLVLGVARCGLAENEEPELLRGKQDYGNRLPFTYAELQQYYPSYASYSDAAVWAILHQGNYGATCATRMSIAFDCAAGGAYKITSSDEGYIFSDENSLCNISGGVVTNATYFGKMMEKRYGAGYPSLPGQPGVLVGTNICWSSPHSPGCENVSKEWSGHVALWNGYGCDGSCALGNAQWTYAFWPTADASGGGSAGELLACKQDTSCRTDHGNTTGTCSGPRGLCYQWETCGTSRDCCPCKCDPGNGLQIDVEAGHVCGGETSQAPAPVPTATPSPSSATPSCITDTQCRWDHGNTPGGSCPNNVCGFNQQCGTSTNCCPCGCDPDDDGMKNYEVDAGHICGGLDDPNAPVVNTVTTPEPPAPEPPRGNNCDSYGVCDCGEGLHCYYGQPAATGDASSTATYCRSGTILWWCCPKDYWVANPVADAAGLFPSCELKL